MLAADRGIDCVTVDYAVLKGTDDPSARLFWGAAGRRDRGARVAVVRRSRRRRGPTDGGTAIRAARRSGATERAARRSPGRRSHAGTAASTRGRLDRVRSGRSTPVRRGRGLSIDRARGCSRRRRPRSADRYPRCCWSRPTARCRPHADDRADEPLQLALRPPCSPGGPDGVQHLDHNNRPVSAASSRSSLVVAARRRRCPGVDPGRAEGRRRGRLQRDPRAARRWRSVPGRSLVRRESADRRPGRDPSALLDDGSWASSSRRSRVGDRAPRRLLARRRAASRAASEHAQPRSAAGARARCSLAPVIKLPAGCSPSSACIDCGPSATPSSGTAACERLSSGAVTGR